MIRCVPQFFPLPEARHIPGRTPRPAGGVLARAVAAAPPVTNPGAWAENRAWLYGQVLHDAGYFWEAHEVWEPVWQRAAPNSAERALVAGLIHLSNACLKLDMGRPRAAARLIALALGAVRGLTGEVMGLPVDAVRAGLQRFEAELTRGAAAARAAYPRISEI